MAIEFFADLDLNSNLLHEVGNAVLDTDGPNYGQVKQAVRDLDWKNSVRVASASNINLAAPGANVDGVAMNVGDRFLARGQTLGAENGIYVWQGAATPATRAVDADNATEINAGMTVSVEEGTNADQLWMLTTDNPIVVGTTILTFKLIGGSPYTTLVGDGVTQTLVVTHNLNQEVQVTVYRNSAPFVEVQPEVRHTDLNTTTLRFTPAPAVNEFKVVIG
jgi:hypothetical protein